MIILRDKLFSKKDKAENAAIAAGTGTIVGTGIAQKRIINKALDKAAEKVGGKRIGNEIYVHKTVKADPFDAAMARVTGQEEGYRMLLKTKAKKLAQKEAERGYEMATRTVRRNKPFQRMKKAQIASLALVGAGATSKLAKKIKEKKNDNPKK